MLSTSDAILPAVRSDWSEPSAPARPVEPEAPAIAIAARRELPAWIAFSISTALHVLAVILLWQWAPMFVPSDESPPLQIELRAGTNDGDADTAKAAPIEPPPLPQPKPRAIAPRKPAVVPTTVATTAPLPPLPMLPAAPAMAAPVVIPESIVDGADTAASTVSAADRASVRILSWLSQYRRYPASARRARLEGTVEIVVVLLPDGRLVQQRIAQSSGHAVLDQAALELLRRASPVPAATFESGDAAQLELHLPIVYRLSI